MEKNTENTQSTLIKLSCLILKPYITKLLLNPVASLGGTGGGHPPGGWHPNEKNVAEFTKKSDSDDQKKVVIFSGINK